MPEGNRHILSGFFMVNKTLDKNRAISDPDKIAKLYGVDQAQAMVIYSMMAAVEDAIKELILVQSKIVKEQAGFIQKQTETAQAIERELGREKDAIKILEHIEASLTGQPSPAHHILSEIFMPIVANNFEKLSPEELATVFAVIKTALERAR